MRGGNSGQSKGNKTQKQTNVEIKVGLAAQTDGLIKLCCGKTQVITVNSLADKDEMMASLSVDADDVEGRYATQPCLVKWICLFVLFWTSHFKIFNNGLELVLKFFNTLFTVCQRYAPWFGGVVMLLPTSIYFLRKRLGLDGDR